MFFHSVYTMIRSVFLTGTIRPPVDTIRNTIRVAAANISAIFPAAAVTVATHTLTGAGYRSFATKISVIFPTTAVAIPLQTLTDATGVPGAIVRTISPARSIAVALGAVQNTIDLATVTIITVGLNQVVILDHKILTTQRAGSGTLVIGKGLDR